MKFYRHYFGKDNLNESLQKWFQNWPYPKKPEFRRYSSQESKWTRKCKEHYDFIKSYLNILLDEYEFRFNKEHQFEQFRIWENENCLNIPLANLRKITLPWKNISKKYRSNDIILSYRKQYKHLVQNPFLEYSKTKRDIPDWLECKDLGQYMI